jgi:FKBP-type peptidyl-prolyl cis-trans isomerase SlyD
MQIENNMVVAFHYELKDKATSEILDSSEGREPLEFMTGKGHIIPGLESQMMGMKVGDKADITVPAVDAYGEYDETSCDARPAEQFAGLDLQEGMVLYGQGEDGQTVQVVVKSFNENEVVIDFNHPLAGKDLVFAVSVTEVREPTVDEALSGQIAHKHKEGGCGSGSCGCSH